MKERLTQSRLCDATSWFSSFEEERSYQKEPRFNEAYS